MKVPLTAAQASERARVWALSGHPEHVYDGTPGSGQFCHRCGGGEAGIQHPKAPDRPAFKRTVVRPAREREMGRLEGRHAVVLERDGSHLQTTEYLTDTELLWMRDAVVRYCDEMGLG